MTLAEHVESSQSTKGPAREAKEALLGAITKTVEMLDSSGHLRSSAPALKDLAEAYAFVMYPNQSH